MKELNQPVRITDRASPNKLTPKISFCLLLLLFFMPLFFDQVSSATPDFVHPFSSSSNGRERIFSAHPCLECTPPSSCSFRSSNEESSTMILRELEAVESSSARRISRNEAIVLTPPLLRPRNFFLIRKRNPDRGDKGCIKEIRV